ncbi:hypothetical protein BUALT_Bualt12G0144900 [Buddleja alternifolia]|uniref:Mce/MlaD domain-containing protein n=1 Tax=Buddleja alternifolia TaxID=168488 RepID=A0AAV6WYK3_9LAMI|nr:hypothetical protein BUALT_Bualt12G0144900 [Buddleja alternifolia]
MEVNSLLFAVSTTKPPVFSITTPTATARNGQTFLPCLKSPPRPRPRPLPLTINKRTMLFCVKANSLLSVSTTIPPVFSRSYSVITTARNSKLTTFSPCLRTPPPPPLRDFRKTLLFCVKANNSSGDMGHNHNEQDESSSELNSPLYVVLGVARAIWRRTMRPFTTDFGFGRKSVWEGGVALFLILGAVLFALSWAWLRGLTLLSKKFSCKYSAVLQFDQATSGGICTGTPVRFRGVNVGNVVRVVNHPSLRSIEAVVEVEDDKIIIPRNSLIEVNQSGLLMEPLIDITPPRHPIPAPSVGPLDASCGKEGLIVCDRQMIKVDQGIKAVAENIEPLLAEVHDNGSLKEVENLTKNLARDSEDLRRVQPSSIMTPENTELIRKSIYSLIFTLKNIEVGVTGDEATRRNLKLLVKSLSRLLC